MDYIETFITEITVEEVYNSAEEEEALYYNEEWEDEDLDALAEMNEEYEPDEEFWAYLSAMEEEPNFNEVGFNLYPEYYSFDC